MPQLRKDPLSDRWVIIAEGRERRPNEYEQSGPQRLATRCPFCAGHEEDTPRQIVAYRANGTEQVKDWLVRVVPNEYPALLTEGRTEPVSDGLYEACDAVGEHEVIVESPRHVASLSELTDDEARLLMHAYRDRLKSFQSNRMYRYALVFKNVGPAAGASLEHSHSQIVATPMIPAELQCELTAAERLYHAHNACFFCRVIADEEVHGQRLVATSEQYVAVCPYASRMPFELWILPRRHTSHFEALRDEQLAELAQFLRQIIRKLETVHDDLAYNYFIHTAPFDTQPLRHYHWHIEVFPRLTTTAGFEWGAGYYINPVPPEQAAAILRS